MSDKQRKRTPRLGRGLSSLMASPVRVASPEVEPRESAEELPRAVAETDAPAVGSESPTEVSGLRFIDLTLLRPNPHQPRQHFDEQAIEHLAASIQADGLMQPIIVRPAPDWVDGQAYEIVAGERRWRAAKAAGLSQIPAIVRELDDRQSAEWSLIENLQREDLNPIERAEAFRSLCEQHSLSHDQIARRVGLERSTVSNLLRLLDLCPSVRDLVRQELLTMGQARAIAGLAQPEAQEAAATRAVREGLSVREVEKLVRRLADGGAATARVPAASGGRRPAYLRDLEKQVAEQLGTKVHIAAGRRKGAGRLTIEFYSLDQFDAILGKLGVAVS